MGMKQILVMMAAVVVVGCSNDSPETSQAAEAEPQIASKPTPEPTPVSPADEKLIADAIVEREIRKKIRKPKGEITEADLKKVISLGSFFGAQITDEGLKEVAKLQNLTELNLNPIKITDTGFKEVAKLQKLITLSLWGGKITEAGLKEVAKLQNLSELDLREIQITDAGLKELAKMQKLEEINLSNTKITDVGLKELAKLQNLKQLWLNNTKVTKEGVAELKKALPNCIISGP